MLPQSQDTKSFDSPHQLQDTDVRKLDIEKNMPEKNQHRWGIILAGGDGRRLQQYVKTHYGVDSPKQFCTFYGDRSMLRHTIDRAQVCIPNEHIIIVITKHHLSYAEKDLSDRPEGTVVIQPKNRETGPAILLPLLRILLLDPEAQVAIFPSDHFVQREKRFMEYVETAFNFTNVLPEYINLLGIPAHGMQNGYGWIERGEIIGSRSGVELCQVKRFVEKPALTTAPRIQSEKYFWNTFTMIGHISMFLNLAGSMMPEVYYPMGKIFSVMGTPEEDKVVEEVYNNIPAINFSQAVLERSVECLSVLLLRDVYWNDWGEESRVQSDLTWLGNSLNPLSRVAVMSA